MHQLGRQTDFFGIQLSTEVISLSSDVLQWSLLLSQTRLQVCLVWHQAHTVLFQTLDLTHAKQVTMYYRHCIAKLWPWSQPWSLWDENHYTTTALGNVYKNCGFSAPFCFKLEACMGDIQIVKRKDMYGRIIYIPCLKTYPFCCAWSPYN